MSNLKNTIKTQNKIYSASPSEYAIESKLNSLFYVPKREHEERKGLHASAIIASENQFCIREQVLSLFFKREDSNNISMGLMRIFEQGNVIHEKWQDMFVRGEIAVAIEDRAYSKEFDLYLTPDAIVSIIGRKYVCEIKSANTYSFKSMVKNHPSGTNQLNLYMHLRSIPRGFVLVEDKNDQNIKVFEEFYDYETVKPYLKRLYDIKEARSKFIDLGKLPKRKCDSCDCKRAQSCAMRDACWKINRIKL